jgi:predicted secreted protein with PEFG-CTERM motif
MLNSSLSLFTISAVLIASMGMMPAFGQIVDQVEATTDKSIYLEGETVKLTGEVKELHIGVPITVIVTSPGGNIVGIDQIQVGDDKKFSTIIKTGGTSLMSSDGTYNISITYGHASRTADVSFELKVEFPTNTQTMSIDGSNNKIEYKIKGGKLISIEPDVSSSSLLIKIDAADDDGTLTMTIPRALFDSVENGNDAEVFVVVDNDEVNFEITTTSKDRTLVIPFSAGSEQIEITGTFVVPEFGTIAMMILAVAIISIIAISTKSRLSIIPRY